MSDAPHTPSILNAPLIGPLLRVLLGSLKGEDAPLAVLVLVLVLGIVLVVLFGYPALILLSLIGTFVILGGLVALTRAR